MINAKLLGRDELIIRHTRTHMKKMFFPALLLVLLSAGLGIGLAVIPKHTGKWSIYVILITYLVLVIWLFIKPLVCWLSATYTITDRRIITRKGIINKTGHDLPLRRINNVNYEKSLTDRILGCGTLIFETAAGEPLVLPDIPQVEQVHVEITEILFEELYDAEHDNQPGRDPDTGNF